VFPVIAIKDTLRGVIRFALENGRFSDTDRGATIKLSHMRKNAASAIAAGAKVGFVREADLGPARSECLLSAHIYVYTLLCF